MFDAGYPWNPNQPFAPEPIEGNSLTQFIRALNNYLQQTGSNTFQSGQGILGSALPGFAQASQTAQPAADYWSAILSGDPQKVSAAIAPSASAINNQYAAAQRGIQTTSPRGGFSAGLTAALPFERAGQVGNLAAGLQPMAAQQLPQIAGLQGSLASSLGQLGLGQSGLGSNLLNLVSQNQLGVRGQDVGEHGQMLGLAGQLGQGFENMIGSLFGKSDRRVKRDLLQIGMVRGVPLYLFRYLWSPLWYIGVVAQELIDVMPEAVRRGPIWTVDYGKLLEA